VIDRDPVPRSEEYAATEDEYSEVKRDYRAVLEVLRTDDVLDKHVRRVRGRQDSRYRSLGDALETRVPPPQRSTERRSPARRPRGRSSGSRGFRERIVDDAGGQRSEQRVSSHPGGEHEKARGQPSVRFAIGIVIASNVESTPVRFHDRCPLGVRPCYVAHRGKISATDGSNLTPSEPRTRRSEFRPNPHASRTRRYRRHRHTNADTSADSARSARCLIPEASSTP